MELKVFLCEHCGVELMINTGSDSQRHYSCLQTTGSRSTDKDQGENVKNYVGLERHAIKVEVEEFLCGSCAKLFIDEKNINDQGFKCVRCEEKFITDSDLQKHLRIHVSERKCEVKLIKDDLKKFRETANIDLINTGEIASQSNDYLQVPTEGVPCGSEYCKDKSKNKKHRPYECKHCGKRFNRNNSLKDHLRTHTEVKPYECKHCGERFSQNGNLDRHMRIHTGEKPYECRYCGKRFNRSGNLKLHLRIHTGDKPYECELCGKKFNQDGNLQKHIRIHTGDKPYECENCGKKFSQHGNLQTHMRTHTGDKPYECKSCGKKFIGSGNLERHMRTHTGEKPYECKHCGKRFNASGNFEKHTRTHMVQGFRDHMNVDIVERDLIEVEN